MPAQGVTLEHDIVEEFKALQVESLDDSLIKKCIQLCNQLDLSAEELTEEWEAFSFNQKFPVDNPTCNALDQFEIFKLKQKQFTKYNAPIAVGSKRKPSRMDDEDSSENLEDKSDDELPTDSNSPQKKEHKKYTKDHKEEEDIAKAIREKSGRVIASWNETLADTLEANISSPITITFPYGEQNLQEDTENIRFMYDPLETRAKQFESVADALRNRLEFELLAENTMKVDQYDQKVALLCTERLEPFHLFLQTPVISTARIGKEKIAQDDSSRLYIESSHAGVPVRTELNLDRLVSFSTFPGQTVAVKGTNPTSKLFRLNAIRTPAVLPAFPVKESENGMSIISACGPFAYHNVSMNLQPLEFLLVQVREKNPNFLILNGPFVDQRQVESSGGMIQHHGTDYSAEQWFRLQVDMIMESVRDLSTTVLVIPSQNDVHHPFFMYPQPRYSLAHESLGKNLFFLNDPSTVTLGDRVTIGSTSADILAHIASEEVVKRPPASAGPYDRISILLHHLLQQGSYYPLYPPAESVCIDTQSVDKMQMKQNAPNILITPSDFLPFVKRVGDTLCINPGRVSKGKCGTFSHIVLHPSSEKDFMTKTRVTVVGV